MFRELEDWPLFLIVWFPHSGCRWLNRSLLSNHPNIAMSEYFLPWLTHSTDMTLALDKTSQVHKARSLPELADEFAIVQKAVEHGRREGITLYLREKKRLMEEKFPGRVAGGVLPLGAPDPLVPDLNTVFGVLPKARIVHFVRHPYECYRSLKSRGELDGDPRRVAFRWAEINACIRETGEAFQDPKRYLLVRYEDLADDTAGELRRICTWIGVQYTAALTDKVEEYHGRNKDASLKDGLDDTEMGIVMSTAQHEAEHYEYR